MLPYKWAWLIMMISATMLFSWWDEVAVWTVGAAWNWMIIPVYYIIEYCVMLPLALLLAKKTYDKLNLQFTLRQVLVQTLKNSLPVVIWRKLKGRFAHD